MARLRSAVLVSEDQSGGFLAFDLETDGQLTAVAETASRAIAQLGSLLQYEVDRDRRWLDSDFVDPKVIDITVHMRPEYLVEQRSFPTSERLRLPVVAVVDTLETGMKQCVLPVFERRFYYFKDDELKSLVSQAVQEELSRMTPRQISRFLPPRRTWIDWVRCKSRKFTGFARLVEEPPLLQQITEPLAGKRLRRQYSRALGRDNEVAALAHLLGSGGGGLILVAEGGAGKTSVLIDAARRLERARKANDDEPKRHLFWQTSGAQIIAGMQFLGEWQERCESLIDALDGRVLCVTNLLELIRAGGSEPTAGVAAFLKSFVVDGQLRMVLEATPAELATCRRLLPDFVALFEVMKLPELTRVEATRVMRSIGEVVSRDQRVALDEGVPEQVLGLFARFSPYQAFPGRSAEFLRALIRQAREAGEKTVGSARVLEAFVAESGLPERLLRDDITLPYDEVYRHMTSKVIGQLHACRAAASVVTRFKTALNDPGRPLGVLLFCGPTGVGKTELAKTVARYLYGHGSDPDRRLVRLDMSEYAGIGAAQRFLGDAKGEPAPLIRDLRRHPHCVVLLDEIEKADSEVFDLLLGILDEGRLTDGSGRTTTFQSAIVIMTSNLGAEQSASIGFDDDAAPSYDAAVQEFFRPEFFNRLDATVTFQPLDPQTIEAITTKELEEIASREGFEKRNLHIRWTDEVLTYLAKKGFDRRYGARPLQRVLERAVVTPLARRMADDPGLQDRELVLRLSEDGEITIDEK